MPHRCTKCGTIFEDGDAVILSGCPSCGWNKFLYVSEEEPPKKEEMLALADEKLDLEASLADVVKNIDEALAADEKAPEEVEVERSSDDGRVESVRILGPGSYELNLDSLLERKELVMAIKEEGSYALHLPSVFNSQKGNKKIKRSR